MDAPVPAAETVTDAQKHQHQQQKSLCRKASVVRKSFKLRSKSLNSVRLRRVFDTFDKNGDNLITVEEINQALVVLGLEADQSELHAIVTAFIQPGQDGLTYDDFVALHESLSDAFFDCDNDISEDDLMSSADDVTAADNKDEGTVGECEHVEDEEDQVESDLSEAFKVFDENGDGFISAKELQVVLCKLGLPEAQQELQNIEQMISSVDQNRDGQVDFFEFKHMMLRSVLVQSS